MGGGGRQSLPRGRSIIARPARALPSRHGHWRGLCLRLRSCPRWLPDCCSLRRDAPSALVPSTSRQFGINSETIVKSASISEEELLNLINKLNNDDNVDGLLVQLPLPEHIDERKICNAVSPDKDVDGFHVINVGRMCLDQYSMLPATPWGVWEIIKRTGIPTLGKNVVVAGRSKNVGMPIAMLLHTDGAHERPGGDATVTISHRYTPKEQLKKHTILADIVISAAGIPNLITADMIKEGAAVIDVGINRVHDPVTAKPKLVGDVDFEGVRQKAGYITPVPGGVGPMTVAMLMKNTIIAAKKVLRLEEREVLKLKELGVASN
ncbi:bifunctional methylenetetrahydrofolate dehydrogenase/cyclohydrolase, mitochondrial isoform X2 [Callithrix jacchus]|uniref:bifunctional methylenetetrahydrofolate dehydrogenase/cyclohydrolase, mitochondrial isoform X2 n=1 Tax=Callithrix jacchus TaxID=9483 RepID=UPI000D194582|nr:bifunctional methylenetetrahydrofolate dehydrogenase/cyclohydrolase, mitochondrial isoform X2 [Callithrix jacchus]